MCPPCTHCTGTSPSTPTSTPPSTADHGCSSTASPPTNCGPRRPRCSGTAWDTCTWPPRSPRPLPPKERHVVVLVRVTRCKGQHVAVRVTRELGWPLVLAGPVGPFHRGADLERALAAEPTVRTNPDVRYWCDEIAPHVDDRQVSWLGTVRGRQREHLLATAAAALFPITWEEPGGTAVTEALALGCPVVGFRRGCLPELLDHGRTGLLAELDDEAGLLEQLLDSKQIDPADCVREAVRRFHPGPVADRYLELHRRVLGPV
ncbi:glycosyltransferase [Saccharothrix sp. NRRL B-16348]|uniref:glycosyltransferase n=1 Tax=Saccharothrix sp. NRRL B-16348 TaxID=1415542 RepID=UPI0022B1E5B0|nr:glycosyltransferase [Saccharothrix sp. NRRL B-16348]